jgi:hypothetical protein
MELAVNGDGHPSGSLEDPKADALVTRGKDEASVEDHVRSDRREDQRIEVR